MAAVLRFRSKVSRHHPDFPRLVTAPWDEVARWKLAGTAIVDCTLNGTPVGRRSLLRWDERNCWWFNLPDPICKRLRLDEGDVVAVELRLASTELPAELAALIAKDKAARAAWQRLTAPQQRMLREEILSAKQPGTRARRAARALGVKT